MPEAASANAPAIVTREGAIKYIRMNRPDKKNAFNPESIRIVREAIQATQTDDSRVVILEGVGGDFCSGADMGPGEGEAGGDVTQRMRDTYMPIILGMRQCDKPFIAKVRGVAVGMGFNYAMGADMVFCAEDARFSSIFHKIGLATGPSSAYFLLERFGYHKAFEAATMAQIFSGVEAAAAGLVNRAVKESELDAVVAEMAKKLAEGPFIAIQATKKNFREAMGKHLAHSMEAEAVNQKGPHLSADFAEGVKAFQEKRKPNFRGV